MFMAFNQLKIQQNQKLHVPFIVGNLYFAPIKFGLAVFFEKIINLEIPPL